MNKIKKMMTIALCAIAALTVTTDAFARGCGGGACGGGGRGCGGGGGCRPGGGWRGPGGCRPCRPCGPGWGGGCRPCGGGDWWGRGGRNFWPGFIGGMVAGAVCNSGYYGGVAAVPAVAAAPAVYAPPVVQPVVGGGVYQQPVAVAQPAYAQPVAAGVAQPVCGAQPLVGASVNVLGIRAGVGVGY